MPQAAQSDRPPLEGISPCYERLSRWRGFRAHGSAAWAEGGGVAGRIAGRISGRSLRRCLSIGGAGLAG